MAFTFDVTSNIPRITQSGTDTGLAGIATAIAAVPTVARSTAYTTAQMVKPPTGTGMWYRCSTAGTTAATAPAYNTTAGGTTTDGTAVFTAFPAPEARWQGTSYLYYMPEVRINVTGTLTNANPQISSFVCWDLLLSASGSNFTSGTWASDGVTPLYDGLHFIATRVSSNAADNSSGSLQVQLGTLTLIGGEVQVSGAIGVAAGSTLNTYYTRWRSTKQWGGVGSTRIRSYSNTSIWRQCELFDIAFDRFNSPAEFSAKARKAEYLIQYVGSLNGGVNAKFTASGVENVDGSYDFDNYASGWVELYNCAKGANLNVTTQQPTTAIKNTFFVPLFQDITITAKNTSGAVVQDVRFSCTDVPNNSPTATITTYDGLKTWDYRSPLTYQATTNASGVATSTPALQAWWFNGTAIQKNLRFPASTATYEGRAYGYKSTTVSVVLGASAAISVAAGMIARDTATMLTRAAALAQTGITFAASGATGGTVTISTNHTLQEVWDYYNAWIIDFTNRASNDTWTCNAGILNTGSWTIMNGAGHTLSASANITKVISPTITNNGQITCLYQTSVGPSARLLFSNLTDATILTENSTNTVVDLAFDKTGTYTTYYTPGQTGTWSWFAEQYTYQRTSGVFTPGTGGDFNATPIWIPDASITEADQATVAAYTSINTLDQLYDYAAYYRTLFPEFVLASKSGSVLDFGNTKIVFNATASSVFNYVSGSNTLTIKASSIGEGATFRSIKTTGTMTFTNGATATCIYTNNFGTSTIWQFQEVVPGTSLAVWDEVGDTKYYQVAATSGTYRLYIPPTESGTYYYAIEKYGKKREEGNFPSDAGGILFYVPDYQDDVGVSVTNQATVAAYSNIATLDQLYDYIAYYRLSEDGIKKGQIGTRDGTNLDIGDSNLVLSNAVSNVLSVSVDTITIKGNVLSNGTKFLNLVTITPGIVSAAGSEILELNYEDANGDSSVQINGGSGSFTLWKIANATPIDDYATGTLLATVTNGKYRFLSSNGFKIVIRDGVTSFRQVVSMTKGIYSAALYFGDQVQLAQSAEVTQINTKVSTMQLDLDAIKGVGFGTSEDSLKVLSDKIDLRPSMTDMENSTVLAKEATSQDIKTNTIDIQTTIDSGCSC